MSEKLYSTGDVARRLRCSGAWVKRLANELGLRLTRLGSGDLVWTDEQVEQVRRLRERRAREAFR